MYQIAGAMYVLLGTLTALFALHHRRRSHRPIKGFEQLLGCIIIAVLWPLYWAVCVVLFLTRGPE